MLDKLADPHSRLPDNPHNINPALQSGNIDFGGRFSNFL